MKKLNQITQDEIKAAYQLGISLSEIAVKVGVSKSSVYRILKGQNLKTFSGEKGRPKKFSLRKERRIIQKFTSNQFNFASEASKWLNSSFDLSVSETTIRRTLKSNGLKSLKRINKPFLNNKHIRDRLSFAKYYSEWDLFDWKNVIFSDESKFNLHGADGGSRVWCTSKSLLKKDNIIGTKKFGGGNLMVWGCITSEGVGKLVKVTNKMNSREYCEVLYSGLFGTLECQNVKPSNIIFMQDNAPCHTSAETKRWLSNNNIQTLKWPAMSPDLNPIEHVWDDVNKRLRRRKSTFNNVDEMWQVLQEEWYKTAKEYLKKLYFSMCSRIKEVIRMKGGNTKY